MRYWAYLSPEYICATGPVDNFHGWNHRHKVRGDAVQPGQDQSNVDHPATVERAMVDRMDDLPVAIQRNNHQAVAHRKPPCSSGVCQSHQTTHVKPTPPQTSEHTVDSCLLTDGLLSADQEVRSRSDGSTRSWRRCCQLAEILRTT